MVDTTAELPALCAAIANAQDVGHDAVTVHETHISRVLVAGDRAFKFKKPVDLGFVDYSSRERRRKMCRREVELNRRLAPNIYLGVVSVISQDHETLVLADEDDAQAVDYAVEMCAFDERTTLQAALTGGSCSASTLRALGARLARFHAGAREVNAPDRPDLGYERRFDENLVDLLELLHEPTGTARARRIQSLHNRALDEQRAVIRSRSAAGCWRDGHGDLRAEHVLLLDDGFQIIDCVEFDDHLRSLDVADDLAFLAMDITRLADQDAARLMLDGYRGEGGDPGDGRQLALHGLFRALLRTKVTLIKAEQEETGTAARADVDTAGELLTLAEQLAWRTRLPLAIIVCGAPASGKSTLAATLARTWGLTHLDSDKVREQLFAATGPTLPADRYSAAANALTYRSLGQAAGRLMAEHGGIVVEGSFRNRNDRQAFAEGFHDHGPTVFIECRAPLNVLLARARRRNTDDDPSDADVGVVAREAEHWDELDEIPGDHHLLLRTDRPIEQLTADVMAILERLHP